jgi:hypothetical protein
MSKIYLINGNVRDALDYIGDGGALTESLNGEQTLQFVVLPDDIDKIAASTLIEYEGQFYDPASLRRTGNASAAFAEVTAEHVTYRLNRPEYNVQSLNLGGTYAQVLARVLDGTDFTPGTTPTGTIDTTVIEGVSRREALNTAAELMHGEIEYDGWTVNVVAHRGSSTRIDLMGTGNVSAVEVTEDLVSGDTVYTVDLIRRGTLNCGDEVRLTFQPFGIDAETRIISMKRNPYKDTDCSITVGSKTPEITDTYVDISQKVLYKSDASAVINKYLNSAEGRAELETILSGSFVTQTQLEDYPTYSELNTKIGQYISGQDGTAAVVSACSGTYQTITGMSSYYTKTQADTKISQAVGPIQSEISLSASYGSGTIGSNVRALLQLVSNPDSSSIMLKASKITIDGDLYVQKVFYHDNTLYYSIFDSEIIGSDIITHIGPKDIPDVYDQQSVIYGAKVNITLSGADGGTTENTKLCFDTWDRAIYPFLNGAWDIGTSAKGFGDLYMKGQLYLYDGYAMYDGYCYLYAKNHNIYWVDQNGNETRLN